MEWISVKERLPENYQRIIVGRLNEKDVMKLMTFKDDFAGNDYWGETMEQLLAKPTHWMPLPPPPSSHNSEYMDIKTSYIRGTLSEIGK